MQILMCNSFSLNPQTNRPIHNKPAFTSAQIKMRPIDAVAILEKVFCHGNPTPDNVEKALPALSFLVSTLKRHALERAKRHIDRAIAEIGEAYSVYRNDKLDVQNALRKSKKKS